MDFITEQRYIEILRGEPSLILLLDKDKVTERMWESVIINAPELFEYIPDEYYEDLIDLAIVYDYKNIHVALQRGFELDDYLVEKIFFYDPEAILEFDFNIIPDSAIIGACKGSHKLIAELPVTYDMMKTLVKYRPDNIIYARNQSDELLEIALQSAGTYRGYENLLVLRPFSLRNPTKEYLARLVEKFPDIDIEERNRDVYIEVRHSILESINQRNIRLANVYKIREERRRNGECTEKE